MMSKPMSGGFNKTQSQSFIFTIKLIVDFLLQYARMQIKIKLELAKLYFSLI